MPFDGIVTRAITTELQALLTGGKINKIYQPNSTDVIFHIRNNQKNYRLLISIHPTYARMHLTDTKISNPEQPPMFCMVLRKHLTGARIEKIEQMQLERIVKFEVHGRDELGDTQIYELVVEIMGKHSNVSLVAKETNKIIHCMKFVPPHQNRHRSLLPGATYILPPSQNKLDLLTASAEQFIRKLDFNTGKLDRQIVQAIDGISPFVAKELVFRTNLGSIEAYTEQFLQLQNEVKLHEYVFAFYKNSREDFHVLKINRLEITETFASANELVDNFYKDKAERDRVKQYAKDIERIIKNEIEKNKRKLEIHQETLKQAEQMETYKKYGELLTAHLHQIQKGDASVEVIDYYDPDAKTIEIKLDPNRIPSENAQNYFKKYRKLVNGMKKAEEELMKTEVELNYLESVLQQLEVVNDEEILDIRMELEDEGYVKVQKKRKKHRDLPKPAQYTASDGTIIYVGKNNKQNEYVTHRLAHKEHFWLHTLNIPGSHVIIMDDTPSEETLLEAAQLAAYYSKARQSDSVPVDYTKVKYVKKPAGAKPGFVTYTNQRTLYVTPKKL